MIRHEWLTVLIGVVTALATVGVVAVGCEQQRLGKAQLEPTKKISAQPEFELTVGNGQPPQPIRAPSSYGEVMFRSDARTYRVATLEEGEAGAPMIKFRNIGDVAPKKMIIKMQIVDPFSPQQIAIAKTTATGTVWLDNTEKTLEANVSTGSPRKVHIEINDIIGSGQEIVIYLRLVYADNYRLIHYPDVSGINNGLTVAAWFPESQFADVIDAATPVYFEQ